MRRFNATEEEVSTLFNQFSTACANDLLVGNTVRIWTYARALFFSATVITTIGECALLLQPALVHGAVFPWRSGNGYALVWHHLCWHGVCSWDVMYHIYLTPLCGEGLACLTTSVNPVCINTCMELGWYALNSFMLMC